MSEINLGVTLFCYGTEYARYEYDFAECVKQAALAGATGYEIVGTQMLPDYPNVSDEFLGLIQSLKAEYGIGPVGYGANNDKGMMHDRNLTDDEMLADTIIDLKTAHQLGCKVMRAQYMLSPQAFERLAPYAELYDIRVGIEIHNPESPLSSLMKEYLAVIKKTKSQHLGFIPDFGCFAIAPNQAQWIKALEAGVSEEHLQQAAKMRYDGVPLKEAQANLVAQGAHPAIQPVLQGMYGFVQFKPKAELPRLLNELKEILPYSFELHGKFHYLGEDLVEPSIPYKEILAVVQDSDFSGYLICEYEDELYCGGTEFTKRQLQMVKQLIKS
jgi:sugar phosphate isomerase/epimerase